MYAKWHNIKQHGETVKWIKLVKRR